MALTVHPGEEHGSSAPTGAVVVHLHGHCPHLEVVSCLLRRSILGPCALIAPDTAILQGQPRSLQVAHALPEGENGTFEMTKPSVLLENAPLGLTACPALPPFNIFLLCTSFGCFSPSSFGIYCGGDSMSCACSVATLNVFVVPPTTPLCRLSSLLFVQPLMPTPCPAWIQWHWGVW